MAYVQIKRSNTTATPSSLAAGELAYSENSDNLFIGNIAGDGVIRIGGKSVIDELATVVHDSLFDANTILKADSDNTPVALTVGASTFVGRKSTGSISAMTAAEARTELNVEDGADVTDATNVNAAGAIMHSDVSETDGYLVKTASETYIGIKIKRDATTAPTTTDDSSAGYGIGSYWYDITNDKVWVCIDATASAAVWKDTTITSDGTVASTGGGYADGEIVAYADGTGNSIKTTNIAVSDLVADADFGANQILKADSASTPTGLTVGEQTIVGRITAGNIAALTASQVRTLLNVEDGANNYTHPNHTGDVTSVADGATTITANAVTNAKLADVATSTIKGRVTASTGDPEDLTPAQVRTLLNVEDGATADQVWGDITGTLSNQTDLDTALGLKAPLASPTFTGTVTVPTPTGDTDAATKGYVDGIAQGLDVKSSVVCLSASTSTEGTGYSYSNTGGTSGRGQITWSSGPTTIDGVTLANDDRILNTETGAAGGIWVRTGTNTWDRATDFDEDDEVTASSFVFVEEGTTYADTGWVLTTDDPITIGGASGTSLSWSQFSGAGSYTADGNGIELSGTTFSLELDGSSLSKSGTGVKVASGGITDTEVNATAAIAWSKMANLTANRALYSDASGDVTASAVTDTELGYLDGVTSGVQAQLDALAANFLELDDTPSSFVGSADYIVVVNSTPDGIVFTEALDGGTF